MCTCLFSATHPPVFFLSFTPLGCGLGRWEAPRSEPWAQALTGRRASTALCRAGQGRGPFPLPSPQCLLPRHAPWDPAPKALGWRGDAGSARPELLAGLRQWPRLWSGLSYTQLRGVLASPRKGCGSAPDGAGTWGFLRLALLPREEELKSQGGPRTGDQPPSLTLFHGCLLQL